MEGERLSAESRFGRSSFEHQTATQKFHPFGGRGHSGKESNPALAPTTAAGVAIREGRQRRSALAWGE